MVDCNAFQNINSSSNVISATPRSSDWKSKSKIVQHSTQVSVICGAAISINETMPTLLLAQAILINDQFNKLVLKLLQSRKYLIGS